VYIAYYLTDFETRCLENFPSEKLLEIIPFTPQLCHSHSDSKSLFMVANRIIQTTCNLWKKTTLSTSDSKSSYLLRRASVSLCFRIINSINTLVEERRRILCDDNEREIDRIDIKILLGYGTARGSSCDIQERRRKGGIHGEKCVTSFGRVACVKLEIGSIEG
jgi:hypothetical protein